MTADDVRQRVDSIRLMTDDPEVAHGEEDRLHQDVLAAIRDNDWVENCLDPQWAASLAREALKTSEIDFSRWYA